MKVTRKPASAGQALRKGMQELNDTSAKVGYFESAKYEDGTPVALVAIVQEFGSTKRGIPPRPTMRVAQAVHEVEWKNEARSLALAVATGKAPPGALMQGLAMAAEGAIRQEISKVFTPPLSPKTIEARARRHSKGKASAKPLVDTGLMLNSVSSQVSRKK